MFLQRVRPLGPTIAIFDETDPFDELTVTPVLR